MLSSDQWPRVVIDASAQPPDPSLVRGLIAGDVAVAVVRNLLPAAEFTANRDRVLKVMGAAATTNYVNGALTTIGPYLMKYLADVDGYFDAARESEAVLDGVSFDLGRKVRTRLATALGLSRLEPAQEADGRLYPASIVRIHADGVRNPLHNDNVMRDAQDLGISLSALRYQLSCIVCVQECESGGELRIYKKSWEPADERHKIPSGLGYDEEVVAASPGHEYKPSAGDVYLINPTHYHSIEQVSGSDRLTVGFFMGFFDDELTDAVVWG